MFHQIVSVFNNSSREDKIFLSTKIENMLIKNGGIYDLVFEICKQANSIDDIRLLGLCKLNGMDPNAYIERKHLLHHIVQIGGDMLPYTLTLMRLLGSNFNAPLHQGVELVDFDAFLNGSNYQPVVENFDERITEGDKLQLLIIADRDDIVRATDVPMGDLAISRSIKLMKDADSDCDTAIKYDQIHVYKSLLEKGKYPSNEGILNLIEKFEEGEYKTMCRNMLLLTSSYVIDINPILIERCPILSGEGDTRCQKLLKLKTLHPELIELASSIFPKKWEDKKEVKKFLNDILLDPKTYFKSHIAYMKSKAKFEIGIDLTDELCEYNPVTITWWMANGVFSYLKLDQYEANLDLVPEDIRVKLECNIELAQLYGTKQIKLSKAIELLTGGHQRL